MKGRSISAIVRSKIVTGRIWIFQGHMLCHSAVPRDSFKCAAALSVALPHADPMRHTLAHCRLRAPLVTDIANE